MIENKYRSQGYSKEALKLLCDKAKEKGIKELYDSFEIDRGSALKIFESVGFCIVQKHKWKKFNKYVDGVLVKIVLN